MRTMLLAAALLAGCAPGPPGAAASVEVVDGIVLPGWPRAVERHIARACFPGPGPAAGVLLGVSVDILGYVRAAGPARAGDAGPFADRVIYDMLTTNCGRLSVPETPVRALVRVRPA